MIEPAVPPDSPRSARWPWIVLALGLLWTALIRVPLILHAADHLDSDLAVDGLVLLDATHGRWHWHYPGTPYMGSLPVLASYVQAMIWGATPSTLVSGGTLIWLGVVVAVFELTRRAFDVETAGWALLPLVFSSLGTIWLSGRITGGHLLTLAWHAATFAGFAIVWRRASPLPWGLIGVWCGLGLYLDTMFAFSILGLAAAGGLYGLLGHLSADPHKFDLDTDFPPHPAWRPPSPRLPGEGTEPIESLDPGIRQHPSPRTRGEGPAQRGVRGLRSPMRLTVSFVIGGLVGFMPGVVGRVVDPYDAYPDQFRPIWQSEVIANHVEILAQECLPRLITGAETSVLRSDLAPWGRTLSEQLSGIILHPGRGRFLVLADLAGLALGACLLLMATLWIVLDPGTNRDPLRRAVRLGLVASSLAILAAFVVNRNIFNSDNYRYLGFLVVPWSIGFGMFARTVSASSRRGLIAMVVISSLFAVVMTAATWSWYRSKRHFLGDVASPTSSEARPWNRQRIGVREPGSSGGVAVTIPEKVTHILGDYWDVYRIAFLSGGKVAGVPFPMYPNRFRGWSKGLAPGEGSLMILSPFAGWKDALATLWDREGRDPKELDRLDFVFPR